MQFGLVRKSCQFLRAIVIKNDLIHLIHKKYLIQIMSKKKFKITKDEGIRFSKISGDYNKIHIEEIFGYNSIFGSIICHGALVISKFLKKINLKKKNY